MSNVLDGLELSTRVRTALDKEGVDTLEKFAALTEARVLGMRNLGRRSWYEIWQTQQYLRGPTMKDRETAVKMALAEVSRLMAGNLPADEYRLVVVGPREIRLVRLV